MHNLYEGELHSQAPSTADIFRANLESLVKERYKSVRAFAIQIDHSPNAVHGWMKKDATLPEMGKLDLIAKNLSVSVPELLSEGLTLRGVEHQATSEMRELYLRVVEAERVMVTLRRQMGSTLGLSAPTELIGEDDAMSKKLDASRPKHGSL